MRSVALSIGFQNDITASSGVTSEDGKITAMLNAQRSVLNDQGFGWRASVTGGDLQRDIERCDLS